MSLYCFNNTADGRRFKGMQSQVMYVFSFTIDIIGTHDRPTPVKQFLYSFDLFNLVLEVKQYEFKLLTGHTGFSDPEKWSWAVRWDHR